MANKPISNNDTHRTLLVDTYLAIEARLRVYLRRRVEAQAVDDLLQEILLKALRAIEDNNAPKKLEAWLYTTARTTVIDHYRRTKSNTDPLTDDLILPEESDDLRLTQELATCLKPLAMQLEPIYRETLLATDFEGKTINAVASEAGVSPSAIKSRASRARTKLKALFVECCQVEIADGQFCDVLYKNCSDGACSE